MVLSKCYGAGGIAPQEPQRALNATGNFGGAQHGTPQAAK